MTSSGEISRGGIFFFFFLFEFLNRIIHSLITSQKKLKENDNNKNKNLITCSNLKSSIFFQ